MRYGRSARRGYLYGIDIEKQLVSTLPPSPNSGDDE